MIELVRVLAGIAGIVLTVYLVALFARMALDVVQALRRDWRPRGAALVVAEATFTVTDPPIKAVRRVIPPLRLGPVAVDLAFTVVILAVLLLLSIVGSIRDL